MAHQMPVPQQTQYPGPMPQQHQNTRQQHHTSSTQQSFGQNMSGVTQNVTQDTAQSPLLVSFILEKPRNATSWEDVVPEQQHVAVHDLKKEVHKFRRNHNSVTKALNQITSPNCRRIVNELVEEQNVALAKINPAMEYRIVSVVNKFRERVSLRRREVQLVRVDIILEAEDSGLQRTKTGAEVPGNGFDINSVNQANSQPQLQSQINNPSPNMAAQNQMPQQRFQHQMPNNPGPAMHAELPRGQTPLTQGSGPMPVHGQLPPPPSHPSHPNGGMNGQAPVAGLPPPPSRPTTGVSHPAMPGPQMRQPQMQQPQMQQPQMQQPQMQQPQMQHPAPQDVSRMPGTYPEGMPKPVTGRRPSQLNEPTDSELLRSLRAKYKTHTDTSSLSSESDISWEDESASSSFVDIESDIHEDTRGREHDRGRHARKSKKSPKHRVRSKSAKRPSRSRSRSHARSRVVHERHAQRSERRHRTNSSIDEGYSAKHSPALPGSNSPRPLHTKLSSQVPANIHIHMNNNTAEERTRSGNASPVSLSREKKKPLKPHSSHSSLSESSSDRASGTDSIYTGSIHTAEDGTWDVPPRPRRQRQQPTDAASHHQHHHHWRTDARSSPRYPRHPSTENMHEDPSYLDSQHAYIPRPPLPHRRTTTSTTTSLPHHHHRHQNLPVRPTRAYSYSQASEAYPPRRQQQQQQQQQRIESASRDEQINLRDLQEALEWAREKRMEEVAGSAGGVRRSRYADSARGPRRDSGVYDDEDEWALEGGRGRRYGGY